MSRLSGLCTVAALGALLLGSYLPWVAVNPRYETILLVGIAGMGSGLEIYGLLILPLALIAFAGTVLEFPWISTGAFRAFVGIAAVALSLFFVWYHNHGVTGMFIAGSGVYVTTAGGLVLLVLERQAVSGFVPGSG